MAGADGNSRLPDYSPDPNSAGRELDVLGGNSVLPIREIEMPGVLKSLALEAVAWAAKKLRDGSYQSGYTESAVISSVPGSKHIEVWHEAPPETHHTLVSIDHLNPDLDPPLITATRFTYTGLEGEETDVRTRYSASPGSQNTLSPLSVLNTLLVARRFQRP